MSVNIKQRRNELNLTLEQIGRYVGVSKSTVKKWENGYIKNMRRDKILLLSEILRVSPLDFLDLHTSVPNNETSTNIPLELSPEVVKKIEEAIGMPLPEYSFIQKENNKFILKSMSGKQLKAIINHLP